MPLDRNGNVWLYGNAPDLETLSREDGIVQHARYGGLGHFATSAPLDLSQFGLHLFIAQPRIDAGTVFTFSDRRDIATLLRSLGTEFIDQLVSRPVELYKNDDLLYGVAFPSAR